jgi:hypothetical protein
MTSCERAAGYKKSAGCSHFVASKNAESVKTLYFQGFHGLSGAIFSIPTRSRQDSSKHIYIGDMLWAIFILFIIQMARAI